MRVAEAFRVAMAAVIANRLRSALTALGVIIGVMSVVVLVAVGQGTRDQITGTIEGLGTNLLIVVPGSADFTQAPATSRFTLADLERVERAIGDPRRVAADVIGGDVVRAGNLDAFTTVIGATDDLDRVITRELARGQQLSSSDVVAARRVAVLGAGVADGLFPDRDPLGKTVTIAGLRFRVIGIQERVGGSAFGPDRDMQVTVPITAAHRLFGTSRVDAIVVKARSAADIPAEAERVRAALAGRFEDDAYTIITQEELIGVIGEVLDLLTIVLAAIAGISLLVGGVGVSNIMLVSVSERTREIGLRKALGARTRDITLQFLLEAIVLTGAGGGIGLLLGVGVSLGADRFTPLPATITWWSIALALGVSTGVGIFFGVWPARRAGRLDPVEALRRE